MEKAEAKEEPKVNSYHHFYALWLLERRYRDIKKIVEPEISHVIDSLSHSKGATLYGNKKPKSTPSMIPPIASWG